jgi:hypothetical protein
MQRLKWIAAHAVIAALLAGCSPVKSLFPLFTKDDAYFDGNLVGEWKATQDKNQSGDPDSASVNERWVFLKSKDSFSYDCSQIELGKKGSVQSTARLVRLGHDLFVDFGPGPQYPEGASDMSFPEVDAHVFARIWVEKDEVNIHFLDGKWTWDQINAGKFQLPFVEAPGDFVLTANTQELRKFVEQHTADKDAFSDNYRLIRVK